MLEKAELSDMDRKQPREKNKQKKGHQERYGSSN